MSMEKGSLHLLSIMRNITASVDTRFQDSATRGPGQICCARPFPSNIQDRPPRLGHFSTRPKNKTNKPLRIGFASSCMYVRTVLVTEELIVLPALSIAEIHPLP